jgi:hypothetical protein
MQHRIRRPMRINVYRLMLPVSGRFSCAAKEHADGKVGLTYSLEGCSAESGVSLKKSPRQSEGCLGQRVLFYFAAKMLPRRVAV